MFLGVFARLYWLYRNRERFGGGDGYAIDPICGMQVEKANAPARLRDGGATCGSAPTAANRSTPTYCRSLTMHDHIRDHAPDVRHGHDKHAGHDPEAFRAVSG